MTTFEVVPACGARSKGGFDSRSEAEEGAGTHDALCSECTKGDATVQPENAQTDGGSATESTGNGEVVQKFPGPGRTQEDVEELEKVTSEPTEEPATENPLAQLGEELETDPLSILPGHMVDSIQGQPAVNKRGYAMIAERFGIEATADIRVFPWENDEGRCVARAMAMTEDGREYSGWATACAGDGDMDDQIIELAETRALKRCVSWASGVGIVSYQELSSQLEAGQ